MQAVVIRAPGRDAPTEVIDRPLPEPGLGQVRIRVHAAGVNPVDVATRAGVLAAAGLHGGGPVGLGWDVSGTVDALGPGVLRLRAGQPVIGLADRLQGTAKTHADAVVLDEVAVAAIPTTLDLDLAATLPLAGSTALQALDLVALDPPAAVLVTGAGGAVGSLSAQLARLAGLRVVAAARSGHEQAVRALGVEFVDSDGDLAGAVRRLVPGGVAGAVDAASLGIRSLDAVRSGGAHVSLVVRERPPALRGIRSVSVAVRAEWQHLTLLAALADAGSLKVPIADILPLKRAAEAYRRQAAGGLPGRLVLRP